MSTLSPTPKPWGASVSINATLWLTSNGSKLSLRDVSVTTLDPTVLKRLLERIKYWSSMTQVPDKTFILTTFCLLVPSNTSPVATGSLLPSVRLRIAPSV